MSNTIVLVTGANRGIGKGLTTSLLLKPNTTVIAAVRDPSSPSSQELTSLSADSTSNLLLVKIDASSEASAASAAAALQQQHSISHIDTIIANAGIAQYYGPLATTPIEQVKAHFMVNTLGPLTLFQAFWPLLQRSTNPKFVAVSTGLASIGLMGDLPMPAGAYGGSKAMMNYLVRKMHFENEGLVAFVISPGWVQTDMGNAGAKASGMVEAPTTVEESVSGILKKVEGATREGEGGRFLSFDEARIEW
ncbi:hypothetical protein KVT40_001364 [Elsinoe batatas]|uniref:Norsolorinic acid ketoreductase n=1 Tax=Elsinoe batatas TaxID=2601811 RepID=A0A8K0PEZ8_9PEZI|nr:hypothetical protein KVT40_001364 [Elsinoe batatas]